LAVEDPHMLPFSYSPGQYSPQASKKTSYNRSECGGCNSGNGNWTSFPV
jgi:hypothetical protein